MQHKLGQRQEGLGVVKLLKQALALFTAPPASKVLLNNEVFIRPRPADFVDDLKPKVRITSHEQLFARVDGPATATTAGTHRVDRIVQPLRGVVQRAVGGRQAEA
eukprot:5968777-Prymnesium_polylepis.1